MNELWLLILKRNKCKYFSEKSASKAGQKPSTDFKKYRSRSRKPKKGENTAG